MGEEEEEKGEVEGEVEEDEVEEDVDLKSDESAGYDGTEEMKDSEIGEITNAMAREDVDEVHPSMC